MAPKTSSTKTTHSWPADFRTSPPTQTSFGSCPPVTKNDWFVYLPFHLLSYTSLLLQFQFLRLLPGPARRKRPDNDKPGRIRSGHGREVARVAHAASSAAHTRRPPLWIDGGHGRPGDLKPPSNYIALGFSGGRCTRSCSANMQ